MSCKTSIIPKRLAFILLLSVFGLMPLNASAGWLDFLTGKSSVDCPVRDAECLFETALQIDMKNYQEREVKENYSTYAKRAAQMSLMSPKLTEQELQERWKEVGAEEKFFTEFDRQKRRFEKPKAVPLAELEKIIQAKTTPDGEKLSSFLKRQMPIAFEQQGQEARDFWLKNLRPIW